MKNAFAAKLLIFFLKGVSRLPFGIIYFLSDLLFFIICHVAGYRKDVIKTNLKNSLPEKSESEINSITRRYYKHLCDMIAETIKMDGMTENDFRKRMVFKNPESINTFYNQGRSVVVLTMHYNNWEWSSCLPLEMKHKILGIYKPLHNKVFDNYLNKTRGKTGSFLVQNAHVLRTVLAANKNEELVFTWLAADQTPPVFHKFWMTFLNQEAMFYPGPATLSKRFNHPVFFQKIEKTGRGKYESVFELLFETPKEKTEVEIMRAYIDKMEEVIKQKPEFYLWSHRRWKHKRPENVPLQD